MLTRLGIMFNLPSNASSFLLLTSEFSKKERLAVFGIQKPLAYSRSVLSGL